MHILIGFGGNLGDPERAFDRALAELGEQGRVVACSSVHRTEPVGPPQPEYRNMAAVFSWSGPVLTLLDLCQDIEASAGRDRRLEQRWGPRVLDLDLLLAPGFVCRGPRLELPHPRFHQRVFALAPAAEIAADWIHPLLGRTVADLLALLDRA